MQVALKLGQMHRMAQNGGLQSKGIRHTSSRYCHLILIPPTSDDYDYVAGRWHASEVEVSGAKPDDLSPIPRIQMME